MPHRRTLHVDGGLRRAAGLGLTALSAASVAWTGMVLAGGPIGAGFPTVEAFSAAVALAALAVGAAWRTPPALRVRYAVTVLLALLPLAGVAAAMYASPDLAHLMTHASSAGWVLTAALPLALTAARRSAGPRLDVDLAFGGAAGVGGAALVHVAAADTTAFQPAWALLGWAVGAAAVVGMTSAPPRPAARMPLGVAWRTLPCTAAWITAVIAAVPAAPRHELATSAGAQALAVTIAAALLLTAGALWWSERGPAGLGTWPRFRQALRPLAPRIAALSLLAAGGFQAASYMEVTMDDLGHYWSSAEALAAGTYPVQGGSWISLPGLPVAQLAAFAVFGHTYPAALAPPFLANVLLPWLIYRAALAAGGSRPAAYAAAVLAVALPPVQIYSLGSAEPDPMFIALLAAGVWAFAHALRTATPRHSLVALGGCAGLLAGTRPEGLLYGGLFVLASLASVRSRWSLAGALAAGALTAPLAGYSLAKLGQVWPTSSVVFSPATVIDNAAVVGGVTLPKVARMVLLDDLRFPLLLAAILGLAAAGAAAAARRRWAFAVLPLAVLVNVVMKLGISEYKDPLYAYEISEFVRHIAYPLPVVAVLAAVGATVVLQLAARRGAAARRVSQAAAAAIAVYLAAGSLYVLATPEEFHHGNKSGSLLSSSIYVNAPELWQRPFELPPRGPPSWDPLTVRGALFAWYAPFDAHGDSAGASYQTLTGAVTALGFAALLAAARRPATCTLAPGVARRRDRPRARVPPPPHTQV